MLEYLFIHKIFVSDVYMEDISNMKCHLNYQHLGQYIIQQSMIKISDAYVIIDVSPI